jgi:ATP-binding cassette subfamily G (WHITE) protein 1
MSATDVEGVAVKVDFEAENNQKKVQIENPVPMQVEFKNLEFSVPVKIKSKSTDQNEKSKKILQNISGRFKSGSLTAVMGASGAGKTSLLSLIAGEVTSGSVSGEISVNGESIGLKTIKKISGFVFQDDLILGTMTVKEAISMSATLRLPKEMSAEEKNKRVEDIIALLSLGKCQDTPIGNAYLKGISGGERKRTAIAMELITNPSLLFLDEPTSGLDT